MSTPAASAAVPARRSGRQPAMPYPELPDHQSVSSAVFWRAAWLRDLAEQEALDTFVLRPSHKNWNKPLSMAMAGAQGHIEREVEQSFKRLVEAGGLLYAWVPEGGVAQ